MEKLKIVIVGAGGFANAVHYPLFSSYEDCHIVGICDPDEKSRADTAERYGVAQGFSYLSQALSLLEFDAVVLSLPPKVVANVALEAMDAKKHVFMEKPLGVNSNETRALAQSAKKNQVYAQVGFNRRFTPVLQYAKKKVLAKSQPTSASALYHKAWFGDPPFGAPDNLLVDGIHALDGLIYMANSTIEHITPFVQKGHDGYFNRYTAVLEFSNGCIGTYAGNYHSGARHESFQLHGQGIGTYIFAPHKAEIYMNDQLAQVITGEELTGETHNNSTYGFLQETRHFVDVIMHERQPEYHIDQGLISMEAVEAIIRAQ